LSEGSLDDAISDLKKARGQIQAYAVIREVNNFAHIKLLAVAGFERMTNNARDTIIAAVNKVLQQARLQKLEWAKRALRHTKTMLPIGSANIAAQIEHTGGYATDAINRARFEPGKWVRGNFEQTIAGIRLPQPVFVPNKTGRTWRYVPGKEYEYYPWDWEKNISDMTQRGRAAGAGNCGEHAAVAFSFLDDWAGFLHIFSFVTVPGHAFVVINRDTTNKGSSSQMWGNESILCDPWAGFVCTHPQLMAEDDSNKMVMGRRPDIASDLPISVVKKMINTSIATICYEKWRLYGKVLK
jgi:hypothetical protein